MITIALLLIIVSRITGWLVKNNVPPFGAAYTFTQHKMLEGVRQDAVSGMKYLLPICFLAIAALSFGVGMFFQDVNGGENVRTHVVKDQADSVRVVRLIEQANELRHVSDSIRDLLRTERAERSEKSVLRHVVDRNSDLDSDSALFNFYLQRADRHFREEGNTADVCPYWE